MRYVSPRLVGWLCLEVHGTEARMAPISNNHVQFCRKLNVASDNGTGHAGSRAIALPVRRWWTRCVLRSTNRDQLRTLPRSNRGHGLFHHI